MIAVTGGFHNESGKYYDTDASLLEMSHFFKKLPKARTKKDARNGWVAESVRNSHIWFMFAVEASPCRP